MRIRVAGGDPHWWVRLLDRFWHAGGGGEFPDVAVVGVVALPQGADHRDHFAQGLTAAGGGHSAGHAIEFDLIGATRQADFHASVADDVEQRAFTGHPQRVPERRDDGAGAEVDGGGFGGEVGQQWHRARRDGVFHRVMFADPHGAETAGLGHQGQFGQVFEQLAVADAFVPAFHVDEQGKFHDASSDLLLLRLQNCVGGGLLPKALDQSTSLVADTSPSGASPLPQWICVGLKFCSGQDGQGAHLAVAIHQRPGVLFRDDQVLHRADHDRVVTTFVFAPQLTFDDSRRVGQDRVAQLAQRPLDALRLVLAFTGEGISFALLAAGEDVDREALVLDQHRVGVGAVVGAEQHQGRVHRQ